MRICFGALESPGFGDLLSDYDHPVGRGCQAAEVKRMTSRGQSLQAGLPGVSHDKLGSRLRAARNEVSYRRCRPIVLAILS